MFKDPFNPTESELRVWANDPNAAYPEEMSQDWDLILANFDFAPSLIKLVCEESPNRKFFLSCLYILSGDCVRGKINKNCMEKVNELFMQVPHNCPADLSLWVERSKVLFNSPEKYEYDKWGWGDLANNDDAAEI